MQMRALLRARTRDAHQSVEAHVPLLAPDIDEAGYSAYLRRALGFYAPVERALASLPGDFVRDVALLERARAPRLRADLEALGSPSDPPECHQLPRISKVEHGYGVLYVLEGATLGAQIIARHLEQRFSLEGRDRFLRGPDPTPAKGFARFCESLEAYAERPGTDTEDIVRAACATFRAFEAWLVHEPVSE